MSQNSKTAKMVLGRFIIAWWIPDWPLQD